MADVDPPEDSPPLDDLLLAYVERARSLLRASADPEGEIISANRAFVEAVGAAEGELRGTPIWKLLSEESEERLREVLAKGGSRESVPLGLLDVYGHPFNVEAVVGVGADGFGLIGERPPHEAKALSEHLQRLNNELSTLAREHARQEKKHRKTAERLQKARDELDQSYWHLKKIQESVPVCMSCSRVKTGDLEWQNLVEYLKENRIFLSHGYCPTCSATLLERTQGGAP